MDREAIEQLEKDWAGVSRGDREGFARIYRTMYPDLYAYSQKITGSQVVAQDAIQDVFTALWQSHKNHHNIKSVRTYLLRSVRNQCFRLLKKRNRQVSLDHVDDTMIQIDPTELKLKDPSVRVRQLVQKGLEGLPAQQREVLYLKYFVNLDYQEIAELLSINYQSVVNHVYRAVGKLRQDKVWQYLDTEY